MALIDLTHPVCTAMPVYPGDPAVQILPHFTVDDDGAAVSTVRLGSHTGTHVDAPSHLVSGGRTVDQLSLTELCGPARVIGIPGLTAGETITAEHLTGQIDDLPPRVLLCTGWDQFWDEPARYQHHPVVGECAVGLLWEHGMRLLGIDGLSPDPTVTESHFPVHQLILGQDGVIVENLRGLTRLAPKKEDVAAAGGVNTTWSVNCELGVFPLPLVGVDGAPARVVSVHQTDESL